MSEHRSAAKVAASPPPDLAEHRSRLRPVDIACGSGLALGIVASYVFLGLTPSLLAHHGILLEALAGSNAAIVTGGAFARIGADPLLLVVVAPLLTIGLYDVFYWWAGRLWGSKIAEFYVKRNPRTARWIDRTEALVRRRGLVALAISYYVPLPRVLIFIACGVSGMSLWTFVLGDMIGLLLWEGLLIGLGWAIGHPAVHVVNEIGHYSLRVTIGLVVAVIVIGVFRQRRSLRTEETAADGARRG